jgi:negative regulator of sigma E activity
MDRIATRRIVSLVLAGCVLLCGATTRGEEESPRDLFKRVVDNIPKVPFVAKVTLTNRGSVRELELSHKELNEKTFGAYLAVTSPQDVAGTRFLIIEHTDGPDEQYIRVPGVSRVVRLANNNRGQALLGSEFSVSDLTLPNPDALDLTYSGTESIKGRPCKLVDVVAKPEAEWQYKKARYAIDPADLIVMRVELSDEKGPLKLWTLDKVEKVEGIWTPMVQQMKNTRDDVASQLVIKEIKYRVDLPDELFTRSRLDRDH